MAQIRDLTPLRETDGRLVALPAVENAVAACLDAIRTIPMQRPQNKRYDTNRIVMYVWPTVEMSTDELNTVVQRILPTTVGAGLEEVMFLASRRTSAGDVVDVEIRIALDPAHRAQVHVGQPS